MLLLPVKKQKTLACIREIQVHKLWTKVYCQKGLTAMSVGIVWAGQFVCLWRSIPVCLHAWAGQDKTKSSAERDCSVY